MTDKILIDSYAVEQALAALDEIAWSNNTRRQSDRADDARIVLRAALEQSQVNSQEIPEGWKLVPVEPTDEMREAGKDAHYEAETRISDADAWSLTGFAHRTVRASYIYRAMLAAAPQPQSSAPWE